MKAITVVAVAAGGAIVLAAHTGGHLIRTEWASYLVLPLSAAAIVWFGDRKGGPQGGVDRAALPAAALLLTTGAYLVSSAAADPNFFIPRWAPPAGAGFPSYRSGLASASLAAAVLTPLCLYTGRRRWLIPLVFLVVLQGATLREFFLATGGEALYRDDHPSFMYRFWSYARTFPQLVSYDPYWNGGRAATSLISSGILPMGVLFLPLWRFVPVLEVYTPLMGFTFVVMLPWMAVGSARLAGARKEAALATGILSLSSCWYFYNHLLNFGTVGSIFNTFFLLPVIALLYRVLWLDRKEVWAGALLVVSSVIFLSWPGSVFLAPFVAAGVFLSARGWSGRKVLLLLACLLCIAAALAPVYLALSRHADLARFAAADGAFAPDARSLAEGWRRLQSHLRQANPLVLFLGVPGLFFLGRKGWMPLLAPGVAGALLLSGWGDEWKPTLQFSRAAIPLFLAASLPAGLLCGDVLGTVGRRWAGARAAVLVLLLAGGLAGAAHYRHFAGGPYATISPVMREFVAWLRASTDGDARILFVGKTLHGYGAGHVALLPAVTGREMMAGDYYAFSPKLTEHEYPPRAWRERGEEGVREFCDLFNVGYVVTYHDRWKEYLRRRPERYEEMTSFMQRTLEITVFRVERERSLFLEGAGTVKAEMNRLAVRPASPGAMVLKYRWEEGLSAEPGVDLYPVEVGEGERFIGARTELPLPFTVRFGGLLR